MGQVWYLIVSIPDLCTLTYFQNINKIQVKSKLYTSIVLYLSLYMFVICTKYTNKICLNMLQVFTYIYNETRKMSFVKMCSGILTYLNEKYIVVSLA